MRGRRNILETNSQGYGGASAGLRLMRRLTLLFKLIYKPLLVLAGYAVYAAYMASDNRIFIDDQQINGHLIAGMKYIFQVIPVKDVLTSYKDAMLTLDHRGLAGSITLFMAVPFIPLFLKVLFHGMGGLISYCGPTLWVDYVYKDTGEYADTQMGAGGYLLIFGLILRVALAGVLFEASPVLLVVTWFYNLIQFLCIKRTGV